MERNTKQKKKIYEVLDNCHSHPTLQELTKLVKEEDASIGQATVYRVINKLSLTGEVLTIASLDRQLRYDIAKDHYHFQCMKCGKIEDIFYNNNEQEMIKKLFSNRKVNTFDFIGYGICSNCLEDDH